jgi:hypothetical protein
MKIKKQTAVIIVIAVLITVIIVIKNLPDERKKAVRNIKVLAQNIEQEYWEGMVPYLDPAYADPKGLTYQELPGLFEELFREVDSIEVVMGRFKPRVDSVREPAVFVSCSLDVKVIARTEGGPVLVFGEVIKPARVCAHLKKAGDRYRVYRADY